MIIEGSDVKKIGNTGTSFYMVKVKCEDCSIIWEVERNRAKKRTHSLCINCYRSSNIKKEKLRGKEPVNKQIKCVIPCEYCGKNQKRLKSHLKKYNHIWCSIQCQIKWQHEKTDFNKGKNNPGYKHGLRIAGRLPKYGKDFDKTLKRQIKVRDGFNCQICLVNFSGKKSKNLDVHHIDEDKFNNTLENLISLCKACHTKLHWDNLKKSNKMEDLCHLLCQN